MFLVIAKGPNAYSVCRVPSMASDIIDGVAAGKKVEIDTLLFGGAAAPGTLPRKAKQIFPNVML